MLKLLATVAATLLLALTPASARAFTCAGKADGEWCHNNEIWICDNGQVMFIDGCLYGCNQGDGPDADCSPPPCNGFCCYKNDGQYCNGGTLVTCVSEGAMWQEGCSYGCVSSGGNSYCAAPPCNGYCCGKADGEWCHNDELWICDNEEDVFADPCFYGCNEGDGPDADCAPKPCDGYCCGKADGEWCHNDELWICDNEEDVFADPCFYGCNEGDGPDADCAPKPCDGYCCGKADGEWCHNNEIWICDDGEDVFADPCLGGCTEGEGPDASCDPPPGFCMDKGDGDWCDGDVLRVCDGGIATSWTDCLLACQGLGPAAACEESGFCAGKLNGWWCHDPSGHLLDCEDGAPEELLECEAHCLHMDVGVDDVCGDPDPNQPPVWFCDGKPDTDTCWDDVLVTCQGGDTAAWIPCPGGCQINWPDAPDACADLVVDPQFCANKDWYWCYEDAAVVWCNAGIVAAVEECMNGCAPQADGLPDLCKPEDPALFCSHHSQGAWCNGLYQLVNCNGDGSVGGALDCDAGCVKAPSGQDDECPGPAGCGSALAGSPLSVTLDSDCCPVFQGATVLSVPAFDQSKPSGKMGNCTGSTKTFKWFACLITSLSMFYEYAGVNRLNADGTEMTNSVVNEDQWREDNDGYVKCQDDETCCMWYQTWFPAAMNPPGFGGFGETANVPTGDCAMGEMAAKVIAAELNSGSPLVAHVSGPNAAEHYLLIVGVQGGVLLVNDPGKGVQAGAFSASAGYGPYHTLHGVYYRGAIGNGGGIPPWYQEPVPPDGHDEGLTGGTVFTPQGEEALSEHLTPAGGSGGVEDPSDDAEGGGCAAGHAPATPWTLLLLLVLLCCRRIGATR